MEKKSKSWEGISSLNLFISAPLKMDFVQVELKKLSLYTGIKSYLCTMEDSDQRLLTRYLALIVVMGVLMFFFKLFGCNIR
jgi:hypothetical protein